MTGPFPPKIIAATAPHSGTKVYLTADDRWTPDQTLAEQIEDEAHAQIRLLDAEIHPDGARDAHLADAQQKQLEPVTGI